MRVLRCYVYDSFKSHDFMSHIINFINKNRLEDITIQKGFVKGFHIEITYPEGKINVDLEDYVKKLLEKNKTEYSKKHYERFEKAIKSVQRLEEVDCEVTPLYEDGQLIIEANGFLEARKRLSSDKVNLDIERLKTKFICSINEKWCQLNEEEKNIELTKMFFITSALNPNGIRVGYLSLRSNYEYFKQQLLEINNQQAIDKWLSFIEYRSEEEKQFIKNGVDSFLNQEFDSELIFSKLKELINEVRPIISKAFDEGELYINNMYMADDFFDRHKNVHDFHKTFYSNKKFVSLYHEKGFIVYRYIISTLYSLMPLLHISPLQKQKITGLVAESVEGKYNMTWRDIYKEMSVKYGGEVVNG